MQGLQGIYMMGLLTIGLFFNTSACTAHKADADIGSTTPEVKVEKPTQIKSDNKGTFPVKEYTEQHKLGGYAQAIFAGGCFWCTEAAFERIEGVVDVISGYSGGHVEYPEYGQVGRGVTGHTEAIYIYYDEKVISYETLLDVLFVAHDPTTLNRQGPDKGEEYRSAIFYNTLAEKEIIDDKIQMLNASGKLPGKIVTQVESYEEFWVAEGYHQNYYELNPIQGYVANVSKPKVEKVLKTFPDLIKKAYKM